MTSVSFAQTAAPALPAAFARHWMTCMMTVHCSRSYPLCAGLPLPGNDELMEKVSLGNREPDGKTIQFGNIGKVHQDVDEGKWYSGDIPFGYG